MEHVQPKTHHPHLKTTWSNFLLACKNCNSTKGDTDVVLSDYFWPDRDNTIRAFTYRQGGIISIRSNLTPAQQTIAQNTIKLTGLDKRAGYGLKSVQINKASDNRGRKQREAWQKATLYKRRLQYPTNQTDTFRKAITDMAIADGYWPVWWSVFEDDPIMRKLLINALPGTATNCFDAQGQPIPRPGGQI